MLTEEDVLLDITIRALPTSVNKAYSTNKHSRRVKTEEAVAFTKLVVDCVQLENRGFTIPAGKEFKFEFFLVCYYPEPGYKREDQLYKCDSDNPLKVAKDAVFAASMLDLHTMRQADDSQVFDDYCKKQRGRPETLKLYPGGYCRILLAHKGHWREILEKLEEEL
jgi:Holliday junction resolvase RusA-like endonuclease